MNSPSVAVVGAGLAGLACARRLQQAGIQPRVFESQRAPGGRMATRRYQAATFDHGAQYFTATGAGFRQVIEQASAAGIVGRWRPDWPGGEQERKDLWVGLPGMGALPRRLADGLDVEYGVRIVRIEHARRGWTLQDDRGAAHADFAAVVLALPAPVAAVLAAPHTPLAARAHAVRMAPCWAVMATYVEPLERLPDASFTGDAVLPWFARNGSKPGRDAPQAWVLHASAEWSRREFDSAPERIQRTLLERFAAQAGRSLPRPALVDSHRWRHARVENPLGEPCLYDRAAGIGFCGDWCLDARIEAAFQSGDALGAELAQARGREGSGKMRGSP
ncbi:MAG: FAD-dependent oxidoreductase [Steroidobacteraceae bacterium]|nr:FAD-dependent oxidoreductase [Steroidobacteraceae bacterium]